MLAVNNALRYDYLSAYEIPTMSITHFACADTQALFYGQRVARFSNIERVALRKLQQLHSAADLNFLRIPPGNRLEALKGDRSGQHSIRINDQWRICFVWHNGMATQVEIVDYHD